ncbi:MAG: hypothetical protein B1H11_04235 [Desulfobacteraceae bacterium 4484_190.1]|nr:MAG: hypothetical protein B1H11_04235 [Desulfobacteraceae bacterium 4484_190.1]
MINENIKNIAVFGAGVMGNSIALVFAQYGYNVRLWSRTQKTIDRAVGLIGSTLKSMSEYGRVSEDKIPGIIDRILPTTDLSKAAERADFVLETVAENPDIKKELFAKLNELCSKDTVFSSNTSGLNIFDIIEVDNLERVVITHWFSPASIIPLVEVVPGEKTSQEVVELTGNILESLEKKPVFLNKFVPAFIVNRIQNAINKTFLEMIDNGWAEPSAIDLAIKYTLGIRLPIIGVAQSLDFAGLDLMNKINQHLGIKSPFLEEKVNQGLLGTKTSKGIYDYGDRSETEILGKRDRLFFKMIAHLEEIKAFEPV